MGPQIKHWHTDAGQYDLFVGDSSQTMKLHDSIRLPGALGARVDASIY
jgi:hypothetical protein